MCDIYAWQLRCNDTPQMKSPWERLKRFLATPELNNVLEVGYKSRKISRNSNSLSKEIDTSKYIIQKTPMNYKYLDHLLMSINIVVLVINCECCQQTETIKIFKEIDLVKLKTCKHWESHMNFHLVFYLMTNFINNKFKLICSNAKVELLKRYKVARLSISLFKWHFL